MKAQIIALISTVLLIAYDLGHTKVEKLEYCSKPTKVIESGTFKIIHRRPVGYTKLLEYTVMDIKSFEEHTYITSSALEPGLTYDLSFTKIKVCVNGQSFIMSENF